LQLNLGLVTLNQDRFDSDDAVGAVAQGDELAGVEHFRVADCTFEPQGHFSSGVWPASCNQGVEDEFKAVGLCLDGGDGVAGGDVVLLFSWRKVHELSFGGDSDRVHSSSLFDKQTSFAERLVTNML
jgi:hypothetical protein